MGMFCYFDVFPDKSRTELRTMTLPDDDSLDELAGVTFVFTEFFCTDLNCDCQRVLVKVFRVEREDVRPEEVAAISYTWNPHGGEFLSKLDPEMPNPFLDPFHRQAAYAPELLEFWSDMVECDRAYALRLRRHYQEIREQIGRPGGYLPGEAIARTSRRPSRRERKARQQRLQRFKRQ